MRHAQYLRLTNIIVRATARAIVAAVPDTEPDDPAAIRRRLLEHVTGRLVDGHPDVEALAELGPLDNDVNDDVELRDLATTLELRAAAHALESALRLMPNRVASRFDPANDVPAITRALELVRIIDAEADPLEVTR